MADEIGVIAKVKVMIDGASVKSASDKLEKGIQPKALKIGGLDLGKFLTDARTTLSGGISGGLGSAGGLSNIFGKGAGGLIGSLAGLSIIGDTIVDLTRGMLDRLTEASPLLRAQLRLWNVGINQVLRPMGDALGHLFAPFTKALLQYQREMNASIRDVEKQYGAGVGLLYSIFVGIGSIGASLITGFASLGNGLSEFLGGINRWLGFGQPSQGQGSAQAQSYAASRANALGINPYAEKVANLAANPNYYSGNQPNLGNPASVTVQINGPIYGVDDLDRAITKVFNKYAVPSRTR